MTILTMLMPVSAIGVWLSSHQQLSSYHVFFYHMEYSQERTGWATSNSHVLILISIIKALIEPRSTTRHCAKICTFPMVIHDKSMYFLCPTYLLLRKFTLDEIMRRTKK